MCMSFGTVTYYLTLIIMASSNCTFNIFEGVTSQDEILFNTVKAGNEADM